MGFNRIKYEFSEIIVATGGFMEMPRYNCFLKFQMPVHDS